MIDEAWRSAIERQGGDEAFGKLKEVAEEGEQEKFTRF